MNKWLTGLMDLVFGVNPNCALCGRDVTNGQYGLCTDCFETFPFAERSLIGKSLSVCRYEPPVKQMIYDYKYNEQRYLGKPMAQMMADLVKIYQLEFDYVLTVPSSEKRKKMRGFDHTRYIAEVLSENLGIQYSDTFLVRTRETKRLKGLSKAERLVELDHVFEVDFGDVLQGKRLLLIDDILTTGATLSACTQVLMPHQPKEVYWLTFAMVE